jgi:hypothetical protein
VIFEDLRVDYLQKYTRSSRATPIGCTFGAPNETRVLKNQNADLQSINSRQNTEPWRVIMEEYSKRSLLLGHSEFRSNGPADLLSNYPLSKLKKTASWTLDFWVGYFKINLKIRGLWGMDIPRVHQKDKRSHERPMGPIIREVIPSWAWERTPSEVDRHKIRSTQAQMARWIRAVITIVTRPSRTEAPYIGTERGWVGWIIGR